MLPEVKTPVKKLEHYQKLITKSQHAEIKNLAKDLKGLKVNLINSTPRGGGVAEILKSLVPLMKGVGLKAKWYTIPGREDFFKITKEMQADIWVVHDPQPAGVIQFLPRFHPSVCRLHIDLTSPNKEVWDFVSGYLEMYDRVIVSSKAFIKPETEREAVVFAPAIDPLATKNQPMDLKNAKHILKSFGIDSSKPLITQVSRFDPWKNPLDVIKIYRLVKKKFPGLQLAMVGFFLAQDDPEGMKVFKRVEKEAKKDPDIFLFADINLLGGLQVDTFVNAAQAVSNAILQNSVREGFGLTVSEAMWKGKAVVGGPAEGIKLQIKDGVNGFITKNPQQAAEKIVRLIKNPALAKKLGRKAHQTVKNNFLMPRLLKDYLKLFKQLNSAPQTNVYGGAEDVMSIFTCY